MTAVLLAAVLAVVLVRPLRVLASMLPDIPGGSLPDRLGHGNIPGIVKWGMPPAVLGICAYYGIASMGGGFSGGTAPPPSTTGKPNPPNIVNVIPAVDSIKVRVELGPFAGSLGDTQDSLWIEVDTAGGNFSSPVLSVKTASNTQRVDTLSSAAFVHDYSMAIRARYHGVEGGWSDPSATWTRTHSWLPYTITDPRVTSVTDSSATIAWTEVPNGIGGGAHTDLRWDTLPPIAWWEHYVNSGNNDADSVLSVGIGSARTYTIHGLPADRDFEVVLLAYRGVLNAGAVEGNPSIIISGRTLAGPGGGAPVAPSTPTLTLTSPTLDGIRFTGSGFNGQNQTHDSTRFVLSSSSNLSAPILDTKRTTDLTSWLYTNAALVDNATYYGAIYYHASSTGWTDRSDIRQVINAAPPPPGGGACPNEPAGFTPIVVHDFQEIPGQGWEGPFHQAAGLTIQTVSPGDTPTGDGRFARLTFPVGFETNQSGTSIWYTLPQPRREVYVCLYTRFSSNYRWNYPGTKLTRFFEMYDGQFITEALTGAGLAGENRGGPYSFGGGATITANHDTPYPNNIRHVWVQSGDWVLVEQRFRRESAPGAGDGEIELWTNGTRTAFYDNVDTWTEPPHLTNRVFTHFAWDNNRPGVPTLTEEDTHDWDRLYISGRN